MKDLRKAIDQIIDTTSLKDDFFLEIPSHYGEPDASQIDLQSLESTSLLANYIYSEFHARATEVEPVTTKVDIVRYLRSKQSLAGFLETSPRENPVPKISMERSPGFMHVFGKNGWESTSSPIGRIYITANDAVRRVENFVTIVEILEHNDFMFQGKTSWNPSLIRTDDIVFYFPVEKDYIEAQKLITDLLSKEVEGIGGKSLFTSYLTPTASTAIERSTLRNKGLSFGLERATICAEVIIAELCGKSISIEDVLLDWNMPLEDLKV